MLPAHELELRSGKVLDLPTHQFLKRMGDQAHREESLSFPCCNKIVEPLSQCSGGHHLSERLSLNGEFFVDSCVEAALYSRKADCARLRSKTGNSLAESDGFINKAFFWCDRIDQPVFHCLYRADRVPASIICSARLRPINRGNRWVPPKQGGIPSAISALAKSASGAAI